MRSVFIYFILFVSTLLLFNCKKYPEGGCERRGPKNILGSWTLTLYEVNGIDSTDLINNNGDAVYKQVSFNKNGSKTSLSITHAGFNYAASFKNNNEKVFINGLGQVLKCNVYQGQNYCWRTIFAPEGVDCGWNILKLKNNELIISIQQRSSYIIKLSKN